MANPRYVKEQCGHSFIQVTVDIYGHLVPGGRNPSGFLDLHAYEIACFQVSAQTMTKPAVHNDAGCTSRSKKPANYLTHEIY